MFYKDVLKYKLSFFSKLDFLFIPISVFSKFIFLLLILSYISLFQTQIMFLLSENSYQYCLGTIYGFP